MIESLRSFYGLQATPPADLFQFFIWEIVSSNALPARRDLAWQALKRIPALTPDAMFRAPSKALLDAVGLAGPHREEKVDCIRTTVGEFKRHRDLLSADALRQMGALRAARALRKLSHVEPAVRARAQLFAGGYAVLPIDEELNRVIGRLMGTPNNRRKPAARRWLRDRLQKDISSYRDAVIYLRHHALNTCVNTAPHCTICPLRDQCASVQRRHPPS